MSGQTDKWVLVPVEPTGEQEEAGCQGYMEADGNLVMHLSSMGYAYKAMLAAAPQPPAINAHPSPLALIDHSTDSGVTLYSAGRANELDMVELIDKSAVAPLLAEVERIAKVEHGLRVALQTANEHTKLLIAERDTLKADLASANADKEAYGQNAMDLRKQVNTLKALSERQERILRELHEVTVGGFMDGEHVLRFRNDLEAILAAPAAKDGAQ